MNEKYKSLEKDVKLYVENVMSEYHHDMPEEFFVDIINDVIETSAYHDGGTWSQGDISLAFQRVVAKNFEWKFN